MIDISFSNPDVNYIHIDVHIDIRLESLILGIRRDVVDGKMLCNISVIFSHN